MNCTKIYVCLLVLLLCTAGINADGGGATGGASGGAREYQREQKIQSSLVNTRAAITGAATRPAYTNRATALAQMLANAAADPTVSQGAMQTMIGIAGEAPRRRILGADVSRFDDDRIKAAMYQVSAAIDKAVTAGNVKGAKVAARAGRDMGQAATMPTTYFNIDHVPDMDMKGRKLSGARPALEPTWATQNTAEAIAVQGARAARWGSINAGAASGYRGNTVLTEKMGDAINHQRANEKRPRRLLMA